MSREIKFRVHCADTGRVLAYEAFNTCLNWGYYWVDASLPEDERICKTLDYFRHPEPLGTVKRVQFTGLHDINGVEIYEGDVLKAEIDFGYGLQPVIAKVVWKDAGWQFDSEAGCAYGADGCFGVIGNIYEHPHLLDK